jgi:hypothetical protein
MAMNIQLLVFRKCKHDGMKSYECAYVGGGLNDKPLAVHCLLHHGSERFDALAITDLTKSEEVSRRLIIMGHTYFKRALEYSESLQFADVDDDAKLAAFTSSGTPAVTIEDSEDDNNDEDEDEDEDEDVSKLPDPSKLAAQMLLLLGASSSGSDDSKALATPVNVASAEGATAHITATKPRTLAMESAVVEIRQPSDVPFNRDDVDSLLAQDDSELRVADKRDRTESTLHVAQSSVRPIETKKVTFIVDSEGTVHETLCGDASYSNSDDHGENVGDANAESSKRDATAESNLRRDYGVTELEVDGSPIQTFQIGGHTRNFEVLPRNPLHRKGQRVRCTDEHVNKVSQLL